MVMNLSNKAGNPLTTVAEMIVARTESARNRSRGMAKDLPSRLGTVRATDPEVVKAETALREIGNSIRAQIKIK